MSPGDLFASVAPEVTIVEVGPRDGLQNEPAMVATADKIELIDRLSATGLRSIEATSFVSPKWIPQLADAAEVYAGIQRRPGIHYPVLVPNEQGYDRARAVGVEEVAVFTAASEAFNRTNTNAGIDESLQRFAPVLARAKADGRVLTKSGFMLGLGESLDQAKTVIRDLRGVGVLLLVGAVAVAVLEVQPQVLDRFSVELGPHLVRVAHDGGPGP